MLQAQENSADEEAGDPRGVFQGAIFAAVCVVVGLVTLVVALYLVFAKGTEFRAAVANSSLGKRMAIPMNSTANRVKRMLSSIGSPEVVTTTDSVGVPDEAEVPPSPASPDSPSLKAAL